ncbi:hypothetical protein TNCV_765061 [Trichonephila clavipes]|nr:hypothetical protein TNCV_765061 [Trichonephila clavipes]
MYSQEKSIALSQLIDDVKKHYGPRLLIICPRLFASLFLLLPNTSYAQAYVENVWYWKSCLQHFGFSFAVVTSLFGCRLRSRGRYALMQVPFGIPFQVPVKGNERAMTPREKGKRQDVETVKEADTYW